MRKLFTLFLLSLSLVAAAEQWIAIQGGTPSPARIDLVSSTIDRSVVRVTLPGFTLREVMTPAGLAVTVSLDNATPIQEAGAPDLPKVTASLVIPDQAGMSLRILSAQYVDYPDLLVAPSKGNLMRDTDPATVPYTFGPAYQQNAFWPPDLSGTRDPFIMRNVRGQTVVLYPFSYNAATRVLRVCTEITAELVRTAETGVNPLSVQGSVKKIDRSFLPLFSNAFLNFDNVTYTPVPEYGNLLVICHGNYLDAIQPYVDWKRASGYPVELVPKDSAGSTAAQIKTYIANYYNTKGLTHVLLVGDAPQIPTNTGGGLGGPSDNAYGYIVGSDHYPEVFVGRFSAETTAQLDIQVQRTLEYEQNPQLPADDWFTSVTGIASNQGPGDDGEMDYQHIRNLQTQCLNYTYTDNPELFDGSQGGNDAPGDPTPPMVASEVNAGTGLMVYCGHGSKTSWGSSGFSNTNVNQLTNQGMYPFIWSVACVNGDFVSGNPCFAEAWLRANQGGQPTGAVGFLGSTINQSWNPPMEGQDEMVRLLTENDTNLILRSFVGLSMHGCMKMIQAYGTDGAHMADTWTTFGDPTLMVRTAPPSTLTVSYDTLLFVTDSTLAVYCSVPDARVTATVADSILATGLIVNDTVVLTFPPLTIPADTIRLVVTAYNTIPYQGLLVVRDIPAPVVAGFAGVPERVIPGHTVTFADTSLGMITTRSWYFPGGTPETSDEPNPEVMYDSLGVFDVKLLVSDGFTTDSVTIEGYIVVDWPTAAPDTRGAFRVTAVPNPCQGEFTLRFNPVPAGDATLTVYDMTGKVVYGETASIQALSAKKIRLAGTPDGIYFVKVTGNGADGSFKLILKR